jgi:hypothetical protein
MATVEYRRRVGDDHRPWHFCANCKAWPREHCEISQGAPGQLCTECQSLHRRQMCTPAEAFV